MSSETEPKWVNTQVAAQRVATAMSDVSAAVAELFAIMENMDRTQLLDVAETQRLANTVAEQIAALTARVAALEAKLLPAPPSPIEPSPSNPVIVAEEPYVVPRPADGSDTVTIDLGGKTWPGIHTPTGEAGYWLKRLVIRGPGKIIARPGVPAVSLLNMADQGLAEVVGRPDDAPDNSTTVIEASGDDVAAIHAPAIASLTVSDCLIRATQKATRDRHARPAAVLCDDTELAMYDCVVIGGNSAVYAPKERSLIDASVLMPRAFAVNGYCATGGAVRRCLLLPNGSGRGWLCERGNGMLRDSVVLGLDLDPLSDASQADPYATFDPRGLDGCAVRVRTVDYLYPGIAAISGNRILSVGGGSLCNASGVMLSHGRVRESGKLTRVSYNNIAAVNVGQFSDARQVAACALVLNSQGTATEAAPDEICNNEFWSNQYLLSTTGNDNAEGVNQGPMRNNTFGFQVGKALVDEWIGAARASAKTLRRKWWHEHGVDEAIESALIALQGLPAQDANKPRADATFWRQGVYGLHEKAILVEPIASEASTVPVDFQWHTPSQLVGDRWLDIETGGTHHMRVIG